MFKQIFSGLLLGFIITLFVAQRSEWVHHEFEKAIQDLFLNTMDCRVTCKVVRVNFFWPTLELAQVEVKPKDLSHPNWHWSCKRYLTGFSWLHALMHRSLDIWIELHDVDAYSTMHETEIAITPHVKTLLSEVALDIPMNIHSLVVKRGKMQLEDADLNRNVSFEYHADARTQREIQKIHVSLLSGEGKQQDIPYFSGLGGTLSGELRDEKLTHVATDCHCMVPQIHAESPVFITGAWKDTEGTWRLYNAEKTLLCDPLVLIQRPEGLWASLRASLPVSYCLFLGIAQTHFDPKSVRGTCTIAAQGYVDQWKQLDGHISFDGVKHASYAPELTSQLTFKKRNELWKGTLHASLNDVLKLQSDWTYDQSQDTGQLNITNQTDFKVPTGSYWHVLPQQMKMAVARNGAKMNIDYEGAAQHDLIDKTAALRGSLVIENNNIVLRGTYNDETYAASANLDQYPYFESVIYQNAQAQQQFACTYAPATSSLQGSVQFSFIRNFFKQWYNYDVQGQGALEWDVKNTPVGWEGAVHLVPGAIRLPETYNFINGLDAKFAFDVPNRMLRIEDLVCQLHAGSVQCKTGSIGFDAEGKPDFMYVPLLFEQCMLNFKRDLFAMISGTLSLTKQKNSVPSLTGHLFIERAQLKENLFSPEFQKQLFAYSNTMVASHCPDMACDVTIESMHPIRIDTNVLKTSAQVHIAIKNNVADPEVAGKVRLLGGTIEFPYKPLTITEGTMYVLPGQLHNPMVELRAKNMIKNHMVALQVTGSLDQHHIMLDATPPLNEEQIISLLLVGSHEESLAMMAPALLVQNIKHALFGINEPTVFEKYMQKIAKPLNIHLVPSFIDQTGRGGLRGALEIEVNDRWRALIQKNFSLTEDTRFELDYLLSDDITIRTIRDERRDVGGEVEMKWTF